MLVVTGSADTNLIQQWDERLRACQQARLKFEKQWLENLAFYSGRQWIITQRASNGSFQLQEQPAIDRWRVRHTSNRILRIIRTEVTKLSKEEPQFFCMPDSSEEKDRLAAMAGDSIAEFILKTRYFNRRRIEATFWAAICGTSFLKNYYDPDKLEVDGLPGKIDFEAVTAFHMFVKNLNQTDLQLQPYVMQARTMDPEEVWNSFGVELEANTESSSIFESRFLTSIGISNAKSEHTKQCYVKEVYVKKCKDFPNGAMFVYGEGKLLYVHERQDGDVIDVESEELTVGREDTQNGEAPSTDKLPLQQPVGNAGSEIDVIPPKSIHEGGVNYNHEFAYGHGNYPYAKIDHIPTGGFYSESVIKSLIPSQKEYNRTRSIQLEHRNLAAKPQWSYVKGAITPSQFNSRPGLLLAVTLGFEPPKPLEQPQFPPHLDNEISLILQDMDDISSQNEITKGRTPPGVEAASAIAYLSEENDSILHPTIQSLEDAVQETGIQVLANVHDYWDPERTVRMTSKNQYLEVREFHAKDLKPRMDFRVEAGSMAPRSVAAKQAFITELMKMGAIEPQKALRYLQMSETNKLYDEMMIDVRHAQRENVYMAHGKKLVQPDPKSVMPMEIPGLDLGGIAPPPVNIQAEKIHPMTGQTLTDEMGQPIMYDVTINPFDAHEVHIEEHQNFQKSQEYELLPPEIKQIIQDHVDEHKMEMLKEKLAMQADQTFHQEQEETVNPREQEEAPPEGM